MSDRVIIARYRVFQQGFVGGGARGRASYPIMRRWNIKKITKGKKEISPTTTKYEYKV